MNGINISSFYNWKSYYRAKEEKTDKGEIIQVKPINSGIQSSEIKFVANGISISANENESELALYNSLTISDSNIYEASTEMYKYSKFIKSLQNVSNVHVIRKWSEDILNLNDNEFIKRLVKNEFIETGNTEK